MPGKAEKAEDTTVELDRDVFMRPLIHDPAATLEDIIGLGDASGYISVVGTALGATINNCYRQDLQVEKLSHAQVADVLLDLKRRIEGQVYVIEQTGEGIALGNRPVVSATRYWGPALRT